MLRRGNRSVTMPADQQQHVSADESNGDEGLAELKRIHTKDEKEKADEPRAEPPVADEFGLPPRPPRRRAETLESLDSPDEIRKQVIKETGGEPTLPEDTRDDGEEKATIGADQKNARPTTPLQPAKAAAAPQEKANGPSSPMSTRSHRSPSSPRAHHKQQASVNSVSEFSHQQHMAPRESVEEQKEEEQWQEMPAFATHRIYDDWGKVLAKEYTEAEDETVAYGTLGGAGKGYTRVQLDEDAQSATSMDDNTAYLFKDQYVSNTLNEEDEEGRDLLSQMETTKELLTEGQRIAYVGVVRLSIAQMGDELHKLERTKATKKIIDFAVEAFKMWAQKIMLRLYTHMEIDAREQIMVEQLAEHGVLPSDLTPALMANARVKNPNRGADESASQQTSARPSMASPRPSSVAEKRISSAPASKPGTPAPSSKPATPAPSSEPTTPGIEEPPPAYEQYTADELTIQDPDELEYAKNIDLDIRWTILCDLFLLMIADSTYDCRSRTLLERVGKAVSVDWQEICRFEKRVTDALEMQEQAEKENWNEDEHLDARKKAARKKRLMVMGLCTVGGGLVIGLSAGLLAPVIGAGLAAGFTAVGVSGTGTFLGGTGAAALIGTTGTLIGGRIGLKGSDRRTGAVKTYEYKPLFNNKRVNLIVTLAGWMTGTVDDVRLPFSTINPVMGDIYSVNWEPEMLQSTGQTIQILGTEALTQTIQQILGATVLATLMAGLSTPIILAKISYLIDNPWTVSLARADATGLILADSIIDRNLGVRPITLVGFSLGSRVIFSCLKELARRGGIGLVQNVYMFGSPVVAKKDEYINARSVVSGRFLNGYATNDWILGYLFRATSGGIMRVAGLASVDVDGVENMDCTEDVPGHMAYRGMMPTLLHKCGWEMESLEYTEIEDPDPDNHERRQRELLNEIEEARKQLDEKPEKRGFKSFFSRKKASQKKAWETYDERSQKVLEGDDKESEKIAEENANVLFDVDAIRREALNLALQSPGDIEEIKKHLSVREIESTLPALKVTLDPAATSNGGSHGDRPNIKHTHSYHGPSAEITGRQQNGRSASSSPKSFYEHQGEGDISMTFEDDQTSTLRPSANTPDGPRPSLPPLRSVSSPMPNGKASEQDTNWSSERNPWGADPDDPEFGQERAAVKMDFE